MANLNPYDSGKLVEGPAYIFMDGEPLGLTSDAGVEGVYSVEQDSAEVAADQANVSLRDYKGTIRKRLVTNLQHFDSATLKKALDLSAAIESISGGKKMQYVFGIGQATIRYIEVIHPRIDLGWNIYRALAQLEAVGSASVSKRAGSALPITLKECGVPSLNKFGTLWEMDEVSGALQLSSSTPVDDENYTTPVAIPTEITLTFNKPVAPICVGKPGFMVVKVPNGTETEVAGKWTWDYDDTREAWTDFVKLIFTPDTAFEASTKYKLTIDPSVFAIDGKVAGATIYVRFITQT